MVWNAENAWIRPRMRRKDCPCCTKKQRGLFRSGEFLREPSCRAIGAVSCVCVLLGYTPDGPIAVGSCPSLANEDGFVKRLGWTMGVRALLDGVDGDVIAVC